MTLAPRARRVRAAASALAVLGAVAPVQATDPRVALRFTQAESSATAREFALPRHPSIAFQTRLAPPLVGQPAAGAGGRLYVAHGRDRLTALDAAGHTLWSLALPSPLASGPLLLADGHCLAVTSDARVFEVSAAGVLVEREPLPWGSVEGPVLFAPADDGGALLANDTRIAHVGPRGTRGFAARIGLGARAVASFRGLGVAVTRDGSVWLRAVAGDTKPLRGFGESVATAVLSGTRLVGLTRHELLSLDLPRGTASVLWSEPALELRDLVANDAGFRVLAARATLIELDRGGHERARFTLPAGDGGTEPNQLVLDAAGAALVVTPAAPLLAVGPDGDAVSVPGTGCPEPLRPTPIANGWAVAACRSGLLRWVSDKAR